MSGKYFEDLDAALGDTLLCTHSNSEFFTTGLTYQVVNNDEGDLRVQDNDGGLLARTSSRFTVLPRAPQVQQQSDEEASIVYKPAHYTGYAVEPVTFIMRNGLSFEIGNIVKYAVRAGRKVYDGMDEVQSEITDLEKVRRYAEMRINQLKGEDIL